MAVLVPISLFILIAVYNTIFIPSFPKGEFLFASPSPHNTYTLEIYRTNGGATTAYAIRGELIDHKTKKRKKIYFEYPAGDATVTWEDEHTVVINGRRLDVRRDVYDWRRDGFGP